MTPTACQVTLISPYDLGRQPFALAEPATLLRAADIAFAPTFVAFTPWTTLDGYLALLESLVRLDLIENVPPVQLTVL